MNSELTKSLIAFREPRSPRELDYLRRYRLSEIITIISLNDQGVNEFSRFGEFPYLPLET